MPGQLDPCLWHRVFARDGSGRFIADAAGQVLLTEMREASALSMSMAEMRGRSVLLATRTQLPTALALLELDGVASRITLCPPDVSDEHLTAIAAQAEADVAVVGAGDAVPSGLAHLRLVHAGLPMSLGGEARPRAADAATEWVLSTSGTTGVPKLVRHTLATLAGPIDLAAPPDTRMVWSTFYDIRRYGGLQIYLRAMLGGGSLVLTGGLEPLAQTLRRLTRSGVTHISGTPSHWRRVLMSGAIGDFAPANVRLSGEIADQAILDRLKATFAAAKIVHAFASTEAGVGFEVADGREGFDASVVARTSGNVRVKVENGTLHLKSARTADRYLGAAGRLVDDEGFVDTGDLVALRGERYYFLGRRGGIINVGGQKVHPEEVEAVINTHPSVHSSLVKARRNPVTGAIVVADVVLRADAGPSAEIEAQIRALCARELAAHKVPGIIRFVDKLAVTEGGKLARGDA